MKTKPISIRRTGETELHKIGNLLERHAHRPFYATQKMDGFSMSFGNVDGEFVVATRERLVDLQEDSPFADAFRVGAVAKFSADVVIQGELCGPGIRGNRHGFSDVRFFAFDLLIDGQPAGFETLRDFCSTHNIEMVPVIATDFQPTREVCLALARATNGEGAVFRPTVEADDEFQGRVSFKVLNPEYAFHH